ncbi:hypothetical protein M9Y10_039314 [Tritrichomonas musculus]|uniref:Uncharacterized protein n=1 Tax=Tritrichomonas musculus TaxID=1915356 RepID=A0ABR2KAX9_9EUKA
MQRRMYSYKGSKLCFSISPSGCLGNHMISFLRLIQLSKETKIKRNFFPKDFLMQKKSFLYGDINFESQNSENFNYISKNCFLGNFYYPIVLLGPLPLEIDSTCRSSLKNVSLNDDVLVINIRSGEIFTDRKLPLHQSKFGQPPSNYYKEVIRMHSWSDVIVTSKTNDNPYVNNVLNMINKKFEKNSLIHDLSYLLNAKYLVVSRGKIGFALVLLSNKVKNLLYV